MTGRDIVQEARTWIGTPFHHAARVKGVGVDCVGLIVGAFQVCGHAIEDDTAYHEQDNLERLKAHLARYGDSLPEEVEAQAGDVLLFTGRLMPNHVALYNGEGGMLHAWRTAGGVVEHDIDAWWERHVSAVYRFRGLT